MALNPLDPLTAALQRKSQATAKLEGVNEDYSRATALRDQDLMGAYNPKLGNYGTGDLGTVLRGVESIMAGNKAKELKPQRMAARQDVANTENALPLWNAGRQLQSEKDVKEAAAAKAEAEKNAKRAPETWINENGDTSSIVTGFSTNAGFVDMKGQSIDISNLVPYDKWSLAQNRLTKTSKSNVDPLATVGKPDLVMDVLGSDDLDAATGTFDPRRWLGKFGLDTGDIPLYKSDDPLAGERIQALHSKMDEIGIDTVKSNLEGLGINPTDKDLAVAFASIPDKGTQPYAWSVWVRDQYLPLLEKAGAKGVVDGTISQESLDAKLSQVGEGVGAAMGRYGPQPGGGVITLSDEDAAFMADYERRNGITNE